MEININLLKSLCETAGVSGFETDIRQLIYNQVKPYCDDISIDNMGNLTALVRAKGSGPAKKVMLAAHMDEIGFIVTHIDDDGFIRFHTLGGFDPKTLTAQRVIIHGRVPIIGVMGSKPIHLMKAGERTKVVNSEGFFIDTGRSGDEVKTLVSVGDPITRERELIEMGNCINCKSLDNRISVYVLIEVLKKLKNPSVDVYAVFTVQEEVGLRGAQVAAHQINPDFGLAVDTTIAFDVPGAQAHEKITSLGKGPAIKIMDASTICDPRMVKYLKETANGASIKWQPELLTAGGTDTASIQRTGQHGAIAGAVSIPTRHLHQVIEMVNKEDVVGAIALIEQFLIKIHDFNWEH
jgi:tetrahedral aminopeptidase